MKALLLTKTLLTRFPTYFTALQLSVSKNLNTELGWDGLSAVCMCVDG